MSIDRVDFDSIEEADLQELVDAQVPEGLRVEYKLTEYGANDAAKKELLKDVTAFANAHGGHLLLGIREETGLPGELVGLNINTDAEILRMEQIIHNASEPAVTGIRIRTINLANGNKIILARIPRSWRQPHRVTHQGSNRFYIRNSAGAHEPDVEELRSMFNLSTSAVDKARNFRDDRVSAIGAGEGHRPLEGGGRLLMHIVPIAAFSGIVQLDVEDLYSLQHQFSPMGATSGYSPGFNLHGFVNERGGDQNFGYVQVFRNGILEATKANLVEEHEGATYISGFDFERKIFQKLGAYFNGLKDAGVPPPFLFLMTLEGVEGTRYAIQNNARILPPIMQPIVYISECLVDNFGENIDYHRAVRPSFDALWNTAGKPKDRLFNEDGLWTGEVH